MIRVFVLLLVSIFLASLYNNKTPIQEQQFGNTTTQSYSSGMNFAFLLLLIILVLFSGLRTQMNDTITYAATFLSDSATPAGFGTLFSVDWNLGSHPLFLIFQRLVKTVFGSNSQWFILCHAIIVVSSYLLFLRKYSYNFFWSVFTLLAFTVYAFSMAAMKQVMAIAVGIWAIPLLLQKRYVKGIIILIFAMLFHPYVFILFVCAFLSDGVWTKKTWMIIIVSVLGFFAFSKFVNMASDVAEYLGKEYQYENLTASGVSFARVIAYGIIPIFSFLTRNRINEQNDPMLNMAVNGTIVSFGFMLIASNGGAVLLGRISGYFNVFTCLAVPFILESLSEEYKKPLKAVFVLFQLLFYFTYYRSYLYAYCNGNWFADIYNHASIFSLF